ncbi:tomoregulin-2a isoform X1 [Ictalurus punctatus]|uniref:Tomoregulin-2a isoform X1 n=1 Tax=Ictalurus punctatus TaxID=7998 RepID=A0A2D0R6A1_ICTPU|nr:tomoregulin-2a isoform X1 [Ictalurus punctatus]XP_053482403.1 tomoregulin-2a isoform X1 [Ictalurus furcatus]
MGFAAVSATAEPRRSWSRAARDWLWVAVVSFLATFPVQRLRAFPSSLSDCQTPTGWNCSGDDDRDTDLFLCDTNTCKFDGECLRIGDIITCICDFKCNNDYAPVCGSNNKFYNNECLLRRDACKQQTEILVVSEGPCPIEVGSGSGDEAGNEGSAENGQKETSTCDICQFGAECDVDAEDVWCVCNIDCSHISFNPVCASDGRSYDNPCQVKEASCQRQERIEVKFLGHCQGDMITGNKPEDGHYARADLPEEKPEVSEVARGIYIPCPEHYKNYCVHGDCEYPNMLSTPSCSCHSGFSGPQCDTKEYNVLYVVPGSGKVRYVLIASIIGALQVAIICVVVLCITRKCPRTNRINRQKQNVTHYNSENTLRASTRLI